MSWITEEGEFVIRINILTENLAGEIQVSRDLETWESASGVSALRNIENGEADLVLLDEPVYPRAFYRYHLQVR